MSFLSSQVGSAATQVETFAEVFSAFLTQVCGGADGPSIIIEALRYE